MELIVGGAFLLVALLLGGVYASDRDGWNNTLRRVSRISRATLEARNFRKLEKVYTGDKEMWTAAFEGRQAELRSLPEEKHKIIRHDYQETSYGPWPRWTCKCGSSNYYVAGSIKWFSHRTTIRAGRKHVKDKLAQERRINHDGGDFLF